jgi:DHA1 family bicyclomycin/chloramphenicol resistance-like MFS transporter
MTPPAPAPTRDFTALPLRRRTAWVVLLGSLVALGAFTVDLYLPAFPRLESELDASPSAVQLTLTGTMLGVAVGQLVVGPLTDALGRRRPLFAGLALHLVASLLCAVAPTIEALAVLRVLQGLGTAAASVVALAVVRDRFDGRGAARLFARLMIVVGVSPLFAPTIGGALLGAVGWRGLFVGLALLSLGLGVAVRALMPETHPPAARIRVGVRATGATYRALLRDPVVLGLMAVAGLAMSSIFGYVSASSFVFQQQYGLAPLGFALVFAGGGVAMVSGSQTNGSLVHRFSSQALLTGALLGAAAAATATMVTTTTGLLGLVGVLVPLYATMFFIGLAQPNAPVLALERHGESAGTAAALLGCVQFGVAALVSPVTSLLGLDPAAAMGVVMMGTVLLALVVLFGLVRPGLRTAPPSPDAPVSPAALPDAQAAGAAAGGAHPVSPAPQHVVGRPVRTPLAPAAGASPVGASTGPRSAGPAH